MKKKGASIILGVTGGIAAYKACDIVSLLKREGLDVTVLLTEEAKKFITALTLQTLSGNKVIADMFETPEEWNAMHISLAERAALLLIAPATANTIGRLANGVCDDILTCVAIATKAPVLIAPAMNENMYNHKIVQANIARLKGIGYRFIGPVKGRLACGYDGIGCLADTADIVKETVKLLR